MLNCLTLNNSAKYLFPERAKLNIACVIFDLVLLQRLMHAELFGTCPVPIWDTAPKILGILHKKKQLL